MVGVTDGVTTIVTSLLVAVGTLAHERELVIMVLITSPLFKLEDTKVGLMP